MSTTIVLVHGAYAESASWSGVIPSLTARGHRVIAWRNPLRGVASDAAELTDLVRSLGGPVVLCGHSYGGAVVTNVPADAGDIVALVYVAGFALAAGESCADAAALAPGSTLAETLVAVALSSGGADTYIDAERFHGQFAADLPEDDAAIMAVTQRPITEAALSEPSGDAPLWAAVPSWFIFGELDKNIPAGAHHVMATRAGARHIREVPGASHVVGISHAAETAQVILDAANASVVIG